MAKWAPSAEQIRQIETLAGLGLTEKQISNILGISISTFQLAEKARDGALSQCLLKGRDLAKAKVQRTAYEMATSGKCPALTIFWLKTQCRWKEPPVENTFPDKNGNPQDISSKSPVIVEIPYNGRSAKD